MLFRVNTHHYFYDDFSDIFFKYVNTVSKRPTFSVSGVSRLMRDLSVPDVCDAPFFLFRGRCLYIDKVESTWDDAKHACSVLNSQLVKLDAAQFAADLGDFLWRCETHFL